MKDVTNTRMLSLKAFVVLFVASVVAMGGRADEPFRLSSLIVPPDRLQKNPSTEISVGFGDIAHLSPWRIKRRFPRSVSERGGQLVTLRDAMLAINEVVAKDEEMPEHAFAIAKDGSLASICDIPLVRKLDDGGTESILVILDESKPKPITAKLLDEPVRDLVKVKFVKEKQQQEPVASGGAPAAKVEEEVADEARKTGDVKFITLPGGAKMEMIWCGPGTFMMGSPATEAGRFDDETIHPVKLTKGFWLGKYEVTQAQWESVMGENRSRFKGPDRPVDSVSWEDCQRFIRKANVALGGVARLPTEAEWEYACRAGSGAPISGNGHLGDMAWYDRNSGSQTHDVGKNQANHWGFYDMHGNVLEWCHDWFAKTEGESIDPQGPPSGSFRVLRGGCWFFYERDCRSAYRLKREPSIRNCIYGFRLACSGKGQK